MAKVLTKRRTVADRIRHLKPCREALNWARQYISPAKAWRECRRGDWMLWLAGKLSGPPESAERKKLTLCAVDCARMVLPNFESRFPNDMRVRQCLDTTERWANGHATLSDLRAAASVAYAAYAAYATAYAAAYATASAAAYATAYATASAAAHAAYATASAAAYATASAAAHAAYATASAAAYATASAADAANIVRQHYPKPPRIAKAVAK